jgi:hypothetical protein
MSATPPPSPQPRQAHSLSQKLTIAKRIGEGRLGLVYAAVHETLARRFAVKVLLPSLTNDDATRRRLRHAVREASMIDHPGAVALVDFGFIQQDRAYITMEFVRGIPLAAVLRRDGRWPVSRTVPLLLQLAQAIDAGHGNHVVHGDLKPNNVMLCDGAAGDRVKVLDFSISSCLAAGATIEDESTVLRYYGTPDYLAPEQLSGRALDARTDVYGFGCVAYRLMTGEPPFVGRALEVMSAHRSREAVAPSRRSGGQSIPAGMDRIVLHCLEKRPGDRYQNMSAVIRDLETLAPQTERLPFDEQNTGRFEIIAEEADEEPLLPEAVSRLRKVFYDTILQLAERIAEEGKAADGMREVTAALKRTREEADAVAGRGEQLENRFEDIRRELRERESGLRYAMIDSGLARTELMESGRGAATEIQGLEQEIAALERSLTALEQDRAERFGLLNTELRQQKEVLRSLEHQLAAYYRRLFAELGEMREIVSSGESRKLYRLLDRCRVALAKVRPATE